MSIIIEMFSYTFLVRAVIVGLLVSLCASLLGVSLVLKRYSMIGDGLSHVGFCTLAIATALNSAPLLIAIPVTVLTAFLLLRISENGRIKGDAAIAIISTSSLAIGVIVISLTTGMNTDVCNYMFGSILAMSTADVMISIGLASVVMVLFIFFYNKIFGVTFDENFCRATGVSTGIYNMVIAFLTAITIVLGMRMMGALLISSLVIFPALTSMRVFKTFKSVCISSAIVSVICFSVGIVVSYVFAMPTGASVVLINIFFFVGFWLFSIIKNKGLAVTLILCLLLVTSCGTPAVSNKEKTENPPKIEVFEIGENLFATQLQDIDLNKENYLGKRIKIQGMCDIFKADGKTYTAVYRRTNGCCGTDGWAGLEFIWDGETPKKNSWIEVEGILTEITEDGTDYLVIEADTVEVKKKRGKEFVVN